MREVDGGLSAYTGDDAVPLLGIDVALQRVYAHTLEVGVKVVELYLQTVRCLFYLLYRVASATVGTVVARLDDNFSLVKYLVELVIPYQLVRIYVLGTNKVAHLRSLQLSNRELALLVLFAICIENGFGA